MRRVGIWGWFHTGNFGDQLMAIHLGRWLRELEVQPVAFSLPPEIAERHGIEPVDDLGDFFGSIEFCLMAAGGFLIDRSESLNQVSDRFREVADVAEATGVRLYPFSVGGSGLGRKTNLRDGIDCLWRRRLCGESLIRLPQDVSLVRSLGGKARYLPDLLWCSAETLGISEKPRISRPRARLGVNLLTSAVDADFLEEITAGVPEDIELHFFTAHADQETSGEILPPFETERIRRFRHRDPVELLRFLGDLDGIVSCKLHAGLTALSLGTPFFSSKGKSKTRRQIKMLDARFIRDDTSELFAEIFRDPSSLPSLRLPRRRIRKFCRLARRHRFWLERFLEHRR